MLWNRFELDKAYLNKFENPNFEPGSGVDDRKVILAELQKMAYQLRDLPHPIIKARMLAFVLLHAKIEVNPRDWFGCNIAGWVPCRKEWPFRVLQGVITDMWEKNLFELPEAREVKATIDLARETGAANMYADYDHTQPDWDSILTLGFKGLLNRIRQYKAQKLADNSLTEAQSVYYEAGEIAYSALISLMYRFVACAKLHVHDDDRMPMVIESLTHIAEGTPQNIYDAMQLTYIYHMIQEYIDAVQVRTLGNIDGLYYRFYKKDIADGIFTKEQIKELLKYFLYQFHMQGHPQGQPVYFAGSDANGNTMVNELSYLILEAYDEIDVFNPKLQIKVAENTPDAFLKKALDMIRRKNSSIVFLNEEAGYRAFRKMGKTEEEARNLEVSGCYNFAVRGKETMPVHARINLAKGIELAFNNGVDPLTGKPVGIETGPAERLKTFEDFYHAYIRQIEHLIQKAFLVSDFIDANLLKLNPTPLFSGTMIESVRDGRDAYYNGAKYNNTTIAISCPATVADSLAIVKKYVYDEKLLTLSELNAILLSDWEKNRDLQIQILKDKDKYGNNLDHVDQYTVAIMKHFSGMINGRKNVRGGYYVTCGDSIDFAVIFGRKTGATPDGRNSRAPLSKNLIAVSGQDRDGITSLINSVTKIDVSDFEMGAPFDFVLHPSVVQGDDGLNAMLTLLRTFMKKGGYSIQGNIFSTEMLRDAQKHPEKYAHLQVRVCGWNAYFNTLDKAAQDEFIRQSAQFST